MRQTSVLALLFFTVTAACSSKGQKASSGASSTTGQTTSGVTAETGANGNNAFPTGPSLSPTSSYVRYIGRVDTGAPGGVKMAWPGAGFRVRVTNATAVTVQMQANQYGENNVMAALVDGKQTQTFPLQGSSQGALPQSVSISVPSGEHIVTFIKRTEAGNGQVLLSQIGTDGQFEEIIESGRLLEVVGENAATGYSADSVNGDANCPATVDFVADPNTQDAAATYGVLAANAFNANWSIIAWSGRGLIQNYDGSTGSNMADIYPRLNPIDYSQIDATTTGAGVVIVNLGVNDINYWMQNTLGVTANTTGFTNAYVTLLQSIRKRNPSAAIIATLGSTIIDGQCVGSTAANYSCTGGGQPARTLLRTITTAAVSQATAAGDSKISFTEFAADSTNIGACYMPSAQGHALMANTLIPAIAAAAGWTAGSAAPVQPAAAKAGTGPKQLTGTFATWPDAVAVGAQNPCSGVDNKEFPQCHYCSPQTYNANNVGTATCPTLIGLQYACQGYCHVPDGFAEPYSTNPPTSGNHNPTPALISFNTTVLPIANWMHSQEHGAIVLSYNCPNGCAAQTALMNTLYQKYLPADTTKAAAWVIVTPNPELPANTYAVSAWSWSQTYANFDATAMQSADCFIQQHAFYGRECPNDGSSTNPRACISLTDAPMFSTDG